MEVVNENEIIMKKLAIVYYSGYGHTKVLAEEIKRGIDSIADVESALFDTQTFKDSIDVLDDYDAIIFVYGFCCHRIKRIHGEKL